MNAELFYTVLIIYLTSLSGKTQAFCALSSEGLHADLTRAVVRSSDWLRQIYKSTTPTLFPFRAGSIFSTLRIAGHNAHTLLAEFKDSKNHTIEETLQIYLSGVQNQHGDLLSIPTGRLALIIQGVISICQNPDDFQGHDLISPLKAGFPTFKKTPKFNNYFQYSLAVIALFNSGHKIPDSVIQGLINGANRKVSYHSVDTDALILTALSSITDSPLQNEVDKASGKLVRQIMSKQDHTTGAFGNQYTTALAVEALQAARVHTDLYACDKAMRNILAYQDEEGSFGSILANFQVTPALLGESFISLKRYACPAAPPPTPTPQTITVYVELVFNVTGLTKTAPPRVFVDVPEGSTARTILDLAGQAENPCYIAQYKKYSFGRSVTSICGVASDRSKSYYWMIYINGKTAQYGVDGLIPKDGDVITFKYTRS